MDVIRTIDGARERRARDRGEGLRVALVPTMGFLHAGHLSLVERAAQRADSVWVSVFVNPTQFGPGEDFERYPRDLERDLALLAPTATAVVFAPEVDAMYPRPPAVTIAFPGLDDVLCGAHRPGHFAGVGLVVAKLFNIVAPEVAVFGQKDAQQAILIGRLAADLDFPVAIEIAPTVREPDGLAMSSRNAYLEPAERAAAPALYRALCHGHELIEAGERDPARVAEALRRTIATAPQLVGEYAVCVDPGTLQAPARISSEVLLAVAARLGSTRLLDNLPVVPPAEA